MYKTINDIRVKNLKGIMDKYGDTQASLVEKTGLSKAAISRNLSTNPRTRREISTKSVRIIEKTYGLRKGALDATTDISSYNPTPVPIFRVDNLIDIEATQRRLKRRPETFDYIDGSHVDGLSDEAVATLIFDNANDPLLQQGDIVIFDPKKKPSPGEMIFAFSRTLEECFVGVYKPTSNRSSRSLPLATSFEIRPANKLFNSIPMSNLAKHEFLGTYCGMYRFKLPIIRHYAP